MAIDKEKSYLASLQETAEEILSFQKELIPFIPYMDEKQTEIFSQISNIPTLSNITTSSYQHSLQQDKVKGFSLQKQFINDFKNILKLHKTLASTSFSRGKFPFPYKPSSSNISYREFILEIHNLDNE